MNGRFQSFDGLQNQFANSLGIVRYFNLRSILFGKTVVVVIVIDILLSQSEHLEKRFT